MLIGFYSDAHGNPRGAEATLRVLQKHRLDRLYFMGDAVGYMPDAEAVLDLVAASGAECLRGNHEEMLLGNLPYTDAREAVYRIAPARERLTAERRAWISSWPLRREETHDGVRFLMVHGSPSDPIGGYVYPDTELVGFESLPCDVVLMGQTHRPFVRSAGSVAAVNVGSCGMPRDVGRLASCAIYDTTSRAVEILRIPFDAARLVSDLGARVDPSVSACLEREAKGAIVGRLFDE
jgi:putative phosphoesterase